MIHHPFEGCLLCPLLCPLLSMAFFAMLSFPPLVFPRCARLSMLLLIASICCMSIILMLAAMPSDGDWSLSRSLTIAPTSDVCSLFLLDAFFVFCAFTKLSALCRARRTATWAEEAGTEVAGSVTPSMSPVSCTSRGGGSENRRNNRARRNSSICIPAIILILC